MRERAVCSWRSAMVRPSSNPPQSRSAAVCLASSQSGRAILSTCVVPGSRAAPLPDVLAGGPTGAAPVGHDPQRNARGHLAQRASGITWACAGAIDKATARPHRPAVMHGFINAPDGGDQACQISPAAPGCPSSRGPDCRLARRAAHAVLDLDPQSGTPVLLTCPKTRSADDSLGRHPRRLGGEGAAWLRSRVVTGRRSAQGGTSHAGTRLLQRVPAASMARHTEA